MRLFVNLPQLPPWWISAILLLSRTQRCTRKGADVSIALTTTYAERVNFVLENTFVKLNCIWKWLHNCFIGKDMEILRVLICSQTYFYHCYGDMRGILIKPSIFSPSNAAPLGHDCRTLHIHQTDGGIPPQMGFFQHWSNNFTPLRRTIITFIISWRVLRRPATSYSTPDCSNYTCKHHTSLEKTSGQPGDGESSPLSLSETWRWRRGRRHSGIGNWEGYE